ncbi:response regulator transcription factor [Bacillus coahuilensis]|uniref:response regulator transcription factor n=1 Tax=Bacillus coahuilensis TaxID=408580 RepID=UPI0001850B80|nr:helix-turn-helix transcriptional regulator [Bacillus coahuilensis]
MREIEEYFLRNHFAMETIHSLALKIGRLENEIAEEIEQLVKEKKIVKTEHHEPVYMNIHNSFVTLDQGSDVLDSFELTSREREIINYLLSGHSNIELAEALEISQHTVKNHVSNIFKNLV